MATVLNSIISPNFLDSTDSTKVIKFDTSGATSGKIKTIATQSTTNRTWTIPDATDTVVVEDLNQTLMNKTITDSTNTVYANSLFSNSGSNTVSVNTGSAPTTGQSLVATNSTTATWSTITSNNVMTTRGDLEYRNNSNVTDRLPIGTTDQFLRVQNGNIAWTNYINPIRESYYYEDFRGNNSGSCENKWNGVFSGGASIAAATSTTSMANGVNTISSITTGALILFMGPQPALQLPLGVGVFMLEFSIYIPILSTSDDRIVVRGGITTPSSSAAESANGIYFTLDSSVNTTWLCRTASSSSRTSISSGVIANATTWYRLGFILNATATSVTFYINGSSVATITTNIPATRTCVPTIQLRKIVNTNNINTSCSIDYLTYNLQFTSNRY